MQTKEWIEERVLMCPMGGCWYWAGSRGVKKHADYGRISLTRDDPRRIAVGGKPIHVLAHRESWRLFRGEIPTGMQVCHHCDEPTCVNPEHLFLGTGSDNMRDMRAKNRHAMAKKVNCKRGHPLSGDNLYVSKANGQRHCNACRRLAEQAYRTRRDFKKAAAVAAAAAALPCPSS